MSLRLNGSTSGYSELEAPAIAGDQTFTLPGTGGTLVTTASAGKILQVVNETYGTEASSSSSTFADTGLTATITPTSASSKILVLVNQAGCGKTNSTVLQLALLRGSTTILRFEDVGGFTNSSTVNRFGSCSVCYLDSPATTSAVIYKTQFASGLNVASAIVQNYLTTNGDCKSTITLLEIAG